MLIDMLYFFFIFVVVFCLPPCSLAITSSGWVVLWFFDGNVHVQEHLKAHLAVVLVLKRLRTWGHRVTLLMYIRVPT